MEQPAGQFFHLPLTGEFAFIGFFQALFDMCDLPTAATGRAAEVIGANYLELVSERTDQGSPGMAEHSGQVLVPVILRTEAVSQMNKKTPEKDVFALLVGEYETDRSLVLEVFKKFGWKLLEARDRRHAMQHLVGHPVQVVIVKTDVPDWSWRRVLSDLRSLANPPQLIVTSRTADDSLWAEVLNVGGYDVMAQPFERYEVERVVASACRHFDYQPMPMVASPA